jgi:ankyrin repeat protein
MQGLDVNKAESKEGRTPLFAAARNGHLEVVKLLVRLLGIDINRADKFRGTPLTASSSLGHTEVVKALLALPGLDTYQTPKDGKTALHRAVFKEHLEIVKILTSVPDATLNKADKDGITPLDAACGKGRTEVVKYLLSLPTININKPTNTTTLGWAPLHLAAFNGRTEVVKCLVSLSPKLDVSKAASDGRTPYQVAGAEEVRAVPCSVVSALYPSPAPVAAPLPASASASASASLTVPVVTLKDAGKQIWVATQASDVGRLRTLCNLWGDNKDVTNWANPEAVDFGGGLKIAGSTALHLAASHPGTVKALKLLVSQRLISTLKARRAFRRFLSPSVRTASMPSGCYPRFLASKPI